MNKIRSLKIALLIVILAEEIRNAKGETRKFIPEDSNGFSDITKKSMAETKKYFG